MVGFNINVVGAYWNAFACHGSSSRFWTLKDQPGLDEEHATDKSEESAPLEAVGVAVANSCGRLAALGGKK